MRSVYIFIITGIFVLCAIVTLSAQTVSVPLSYWGYDAVERWEVRGLISNAFTSSKPFSRLEMAEYIADAWKTYRESPEKFTRTDVEQLSYLSFDFAEELKSYDLPPADGTWEPRLRKVFRKQPLKFFNKLFYTNYRNGLSFHHNEFNLYADLVLNTSSQQLLDSLPGRFRQSGWSNGVLFRGNLGHYVGFYFNLTDNHMQDQRWQGQTIPYEVLQESGYPQLAARGDNGTFDFDENAATLTFNYKYFYLVYGREYNQWGVGHNGNLMLSTNAPLYDQIKFVVRYWRFKYTHLTAFLEYISPEARRSIKSQPYISQYWSGNRLDLDLGRGWQIGLSEAIIYGDRPLQVGYLNPLSFFKSLEHFYGDLDNGSLSLEFQWRALPGLKLYGEWFIDDITTGQLGSNFYGNKFAWQGGFFLVNPFSLPDVDFLVEYTRIKPYVYSQSYRDYNKYKHYDTILGDFIGPNSDDWYFRLRRRFGKFLEIGLDYEQYRHGSNPADRNVGGDPDQPHVGGDARDAVFLDGILNVQKSWGGSVQYEFVRNLLGEFRLHRAQYGSRDWQSLVDFRLSLNFGYRQEKFRNVFPVTH